MFELNGTLVIFVVSFLIFMWALNLVMLKPVGKVLEERKKLIEDRIAAGKAAHEQAEELFAKYEEDLRAIRHEAQTIINKAIESANRERDKQLAKIQEEGKARIDKAIAEIADERASLLDQLVAHEREMIEAITRKVLGDESVNVEVDESKLRQTLEGVH